MDRKMLPAGLSAEEAVAMIRKQDDEERARQAAARPLSRRRCCNTKRGQTSPHDPECQAQAGARVRDDQRERHRLLRAVSDRCTELATPRDSLNDEPGKRLHIAGECDPKTGARLTLCKMRVVSRDRAPWVFRPCSNCLTIAARAAEVKR